MVVEIANIAAAIGGVLVICALVWFAARPDHDRQREDEARAHYDRYGYWPDD